MAKKINYFNIGSDWEVKYVRKLEFGTYFTLQIPGLSLYNLRVVPAGKSYEAFIAMPQKKGSDNNYYDDYKVWLSDEDTEKILAEVDRILDEEFEKEKNAGRKARR